MASGTRESDADTQLMGLSFEPNVTTDVTLKRNDTGLFVAAAVDKPVVEHNRRGAGIIDSSLLDAPQEAGVAMADTFYSRLRSRNPGPVEDGREEGEGSVRQS